MTQRGAWMAVMAAAGMLLGAGSTAAAKNCQTAADCGGAPATCELTTYQTCAGSDPNCPAGSACADKPTMLNQANCAPYVEGICRQPYELPCKVDADCGVGFRCLEQIGQACSGSGTTGGNGVPPSFHEECHETRGTFACELIETSCTRERDCASGLRCLQSQPSACGGAVASPDSPTSGDAVAPEADCTKVPMLCAPDGYFGDLATQHKGEDAGDDGIAVDAPVPAVDEESPESDRPTRSNGDGCSLVAGPSVGHHGLSWLFVVGVLVIKRRRRKGR